MLVSRRLRLFSFTSILVFLVPLVGVVEKISNPTLAEAQENNSNISSGLQLRNITNMSGSTENESQNAAQIKNITEISNTTSGEPIRLQQIVTLKNTASDAVFNDIVNEVKNKGGEIIYDYKDILNAFAFRAPNDEVLTDIVTNLKSNASVASVTTDKTARIMPE